MISISEFFTESLYYLMSKFVTKYKQKHFLESVKLVRIFKLLISEVIEESKIKNSPESLFPILAAIGPFCFNFLDSSVSSNMS